MISALGIDVGSTTTKIVGIDILGNLIWHYIEAVDPYIEAQVDRFLSIAQTDAGAPKDVPIIATGYGRRLVYSATRKITEITCHARGIFREFSHGGTLVDIGGQDSKVIAIAPRGEVIDFMMSDKCAAGTGRFLENTAHRLNIPVEKIGELALSTSEEVTISNTCTVFAESEVISLIAHGVRLEPILRGLHRSLILRIVAMVRSVGLSLPLMLSGGVAWNPAIRAMLGETLNTEIVLPRYPQFTGAYGAALIALEGN